MEHRAAYHPVLLALVLSVAAGACGGDGDAGGQSPVVPVDSAPPQAPVRLHVLFVGNSLTYYNDLPRTVAGIAAAAGDDIRVSMVAGPKLTLMDQLQAGGPAETAIRVGGWDVVVLQQSAPIDGAGRDSLVVAAERFDTLIRSVGARPAVYMVWPPAGLPEGFCAVRAAFQAAAAAVGGVFLPAGSAWQYALQLDGSLPLYDPDGIHPAPLGTWLAAVTIWAQLTGHDARRLPSQVVVDGVRRNVPAPTVDLLKDAAYMATSSAGSATGDGSCEDGPAPAPF